MTVREAIKRADEVAPNALSNDLKCQFLNEAEGAVQTEVLLMSPYETVKYMLSGTYEGNVCYPDARTLRTETPHGFVGAGTITIGTYKVRGYVTDACTFRAYNSAFTESGWAPATVEFDGGDVELIAMPPHDKLYWHYVAAMIHFANADYDRYQNTLALYNTSLGEFMRWYAMNYRPADN